MTCPLCDNKKVLKEKVLDNSFYKCEQCHLLFLKREELPKIDKEKNRYLKHNNDIKILKYREYLEKAIEPIYKFINKNSKILDYGSGLEKPLENILKEKGYKNVESYDPLFFDLKVEKDFYDLIICNQVAEHFHYPMKEFMKIQETLKNEGMFFISTNLWDEKLDLNNWFYLKDFTHVSIFNEKTIYWIAKRLFNCEVKKTGDNSFILFNRKK